MKKILIFANLIIIMLILTGCPDVNRNEEEILKEKVVQEIEYMDLQIVQILDKLKVNTDWGLLRSDVDTLNSSWSVVILDLYSLNVNNETILSLSTIIDNCIISVKNENKVDSLNNFAKAYSYIPKYLEEIPEVNARRTVKLAKSYIINSYVLIESDNWTETAKNMVEADNVFKTIVSNIDYSKDKEYQINKAYVLLKELQQSINSKDKELFNIKYQNVMESMKVLI